MKKMLSVLLAAMMIATLALTGCGQNNDPTPDPAPTTRTFTDSLGREVTLPANLSKIAISGPLAQIVVFAIAPDMMVGIANGWADEAKGLIPDEYYNLPLLGQLYGGKGELNLETLLQSGAEVVIDVGEQKDGMADDLNALQEQTGIPFVHIDCYTGSMGDTYRTLGTLLGKETEGNTLGEYCDKIYNRTNEIAASVKKVNLLYCLGDKGENVIAKGSYHAEIIDLLSNNLAVVESPSSKGTGNEVDIEQILKWNPDVILFAPGSVYATVGEDSAWQGVTAIKEGHYYEVPNGPYNWMGFPPSVQRMLGMMWMAKLLYPETADYDLYAEVSEYFRPHHLERRCLQCSGSQLHWHRRSKGCRVNKTLIEASGHFTMAGCFYASMLHYQIFFAHFRANRLVN